MFPKFENENGKFVGSSETAESISAKLPQKYCLYSLILRNISKEQTFHCRLSDVYKSK